MVEEIVILVATDRVAQLLRHSSRTMPGLRERVSS
jgi:hypothetical protein